MTDIPHASRFWQVERAGDALRLRVDNEVMPYLRMTLRRSELRRKLAGWQRRSWRQHEMACRFVGKELAFTFEVSEPDLKMDALAALDALVEDVVFRPLTPKAVLRILRITNRERLQWTRDGRLPTCGKTVINRQQKISVPLYDVRVVSDLKTNPEKIEAWRRAGN